MNIIKELVKKSLFSALMLSAATASATSIDMNLTGPVEVGSAFTVEVWANDLFLGLDSDDELLGVGFEVNNNAPSVFSLTNVDIASPFEDDSSLLSIDAAGSAFPGIANTPENQSVLLASLTFMADSIGTGLLNVASDDFDFNQGLVFFNGFDAESINSDLTINVTSAVPVPASLPLLLSGMALFAGLVRRKKA